MPDIILIGGVALNGHYLVYAIAFVIGYFMIKLRIRKEDKDTHLMLELMLTSLLIVALFWKFGALLFAPSMIWDNPKLIFFLFGSAKHVLMGVLVALGYVIFKLKKLRLSFIRFLDLTSIGGVTFLLVKNILIWEYGAITTLPWGISLTDPQYQYHPINSYVAILCIGLLLRIWLYRYELGAGKLLQDVLMFSGVGLWFISLFKNTAQPLFFTGEQLVYLSLVVLGLVFPYIIKKLKAMI